MNQSKYFGKLSWKKCEIELLNTSSAVIFEVSIVLSGKETLMNVSNGNCSRCYVNELLGTARYSLPSLHVTSWIVQGVRRLKKAHVTPQAHLEKSARQMEVLNGEAPFNF